MQENHRAMTASADYEPLPVDALLPAAGAMTVLCILLLPLLFVV